MPIVFVTGASQGIGAAIAREFCQEPDTHLVLSSRNVSLLESVAKQCDAAASVTVKPCDLTDAAAVERLAAEVMDEVGIPDVVVNNAGVFRPGSFADTNLDDFRTQIDVNLISAFIVTKAFLQPIIDRRSGMFVFMGSVASIKAYPGGVGYCAAKHGLLGLARALREETREAGIRVTTILAGATWTPSWEGSGQAERRMMPADDIAAAVRNAYRLSDRSVVEEIVLRPQLGDL